MDQVEVAINIMVMGNAPPEQLAAANAMLIQFSHTIDFINWTLNNYQRLGSNQQSFLCTQLKPFFMAHWDQIQQPHFEALRQILFNPAILNVSTNNRVLFEATVSLMWRSYPGIWPSFWVDLSQNLSLPAQIQFIKQFCEFPKNSVTFCFPNHQIFNAIKSAMRNDGGCVIITQILISGMKQGLPIAFESFQHICSWVPIELLITDEVLQIIMGGIQDVQRFPNCVNIINQIIQRGMPPENKQSLFARIQILPICQQIGNCPPDNIPVATAIAKLVNTAGIELIQAGADPSDYIQLAIMIFSNYCASVSLCVCEFIYQCNRATPSQAADFFNLAVGRVARAFSGVDDDEIDDVENLLDKTHNICKMAFSNAGDALIQHLVGIVSAISNNQLHVIAAFLDAVYDFMSNSRKNGKDLGPLSAALVPPFIPLLQVAIDESNYELMARSISTLTNLYLLCNDHLTAVITPDTFLQQLVNFAQATSDVHAALLKFIKTLSDKITVDPNLILQFLSTLQPDFVGAAATLLTKVRENRSPFIAQCMSQLNTALQGTDNPVEALRTALTFMHGLKFDPQATDNGYVQAVLEFMVSNFDNAIQQDELFALYIRTIYSSLNVHGIELLNRCMMPNLEMKSLGAISSTVSTYAKALANENPQWGTSYIDFLAPIILERFSAISNWDEKSDESRAAIDLFSDAVSLFGAVQGSPQTFEMINQFIINSFTTFFSFPPMYKLLLKYVKILAGSIPTIVLEHFFAPSMVFFQNPQFDPVSHRGWSGVAEVLISIHSILLCNPQFTESAKASIVNVLTSYQATPKHLEDYFTILAQPQPRDRLRLGRNFFSDFQKYRVTNQLV